MRKLVATAGAILASGGALGCNLTGEIAAKPCEAITQEGETIHPNSYPLGVVAVQYQEARLLFNERDETQGVIAEDDDSFYLDVKGLPNKLNNDHTEFNGTDAVVILETPQTGSIGLTGGCIERTRNDSGIPTSYVELPTK